MKDAEVSEIAIRLKDPAKLDRVTASLKETLGATPSKAPARWVRTMMGCSFLSFAAPAAAPAAKAADVADWGMELKLEEIEVDQPPEDPGRQGI